jgi:heme/copper-type cytochrome/quinol oxidase subunit 2
MSTQPTILDDTKPTQDVVIEDYRIQREYFQLVDAANQNKCRILKFTDGFIALFTIFGIIAFLIFGAIYIAVVNYYMDKFNEKDDSWIHKSFINRKWTEKIVISLTFFIFIGTTGVLLVYGNYRMGKMRKDAQYAINDIVEQYKIQNEDFQKKQLLYPKLYKL